MRRFLIKFFIVLSLCFFAATNLFANQISQDELVKAFVNINKELRLPEIKNKLEYFKSLVPLKGSYEELASGWLYFDDHNDKLLIGSSGVIFCGNTMQKELLYQYGYDVVGFGGIFDEEVIELMRLLPDKKYKTIVIFGGVNDLNIRAFSNINNVDLYYCSILNGMFDEAKKHLLIDNSNIYYIKIKPMTLNVDSFDLEFVNRYNNMVSQINDNIELFGYKSYMIPFDTSSLFSEHYIHYNNQIVYKTMFETIK